MIGQVDDDNGKYNPRLKLQTYVDKRVEITRDKDDGIILG